MVEVIPKQVHFFPVCDMLTAAGLDHFLLSNGDIVVLPIDSGHATIRRPEGRDKTYDKDKIDFVIKSMGGNGA